MFLSITTIDYFGQVIAPFKSTRQCSKMCGFIFIRCPRWTDKTCCAWCNKVGSFRLPWFLFQLKNLTITLRWPISYTQCVDLFMAWQNYENKPDSDRSSHVRANLLSPQPLDSYFFPDCTKKFAIGLTVCFSEVLPVLIVEYKAKNKITKM